VQINLIFTGTIDLKNREKGSLVPCLGVLGQKLFERLGLGQELSIHGCVGKRGSAKMRLRGDIVDVLLDVRARFPLR